MPCPLHLISTTIPGCGPPDSRCPLYSGVSGRAMAISFNYSRCDIRLISDVKFLSLRCAYRRTSTVCNANPGSYRRSPDFSRQNKQGYSRNRNRHNEEKDSFEDFEESETLPSKNGSLLSFSGNQKFQQTATPGPREKEIVELFRKVQAQLRERVAKKEDRKVEESQGKNKENETVDSLLKLLRKHSVQQGKKNNNSVHNRDFILDQPEQVESRANISNSNNNNVKHEIQEIPSPYVSRPKSNFQKRSPVPEIKYKPIFTEDSINSVLNGRRNETTLKPEDEEFSKIDIQSDVGPLPSEENVFDDEMSEDEASEIYEDEHDDAGEEQNPVEISKLSGMKLTELRALAKSRGLKGFSKLKKNDLIDLMSGGSV